MAKFEYKIVHINAQKWTSSGLPGDINQDFDDWGREGWELVATESINRPVLMWGSSTVGLVAVFKRAIKP